MREADLSAAPSSPITGGPLPVIHAALAKWRTALVALVAAVQALVLVYMVADRESLLASGRHITLDVRPVDPRSLFRGDYVILSYDISRLPAALFNPMPTNGNRHYVRMKHEAGTWKAVAVSNAMPGKGADDEIVLAGHVRYVPPDVGAESFVLMSYGIESFFVPEGTGKEIEQEIRPGRVKVDLAVAGSGEAAIKALVGDGARIEAEPLL